MNETEAVLAWMDRIEARLHGSPPFLNPCPSGVEWVQLRKLLERPSDEADAWAMLTELYRVLVRAGAGSGEKRHAYSFSRRRAK